MIPETHLEAGHFKHTWDALEDPKNWKGRHMNLDRSQLLAMAQAVSLEIPESDVENVRLRLSGLLTEMEAIERELGARMDAVEPVPPVYPREEL